MFLHPQRPPVSFSLTLHFDLHFPKNLRVFSIVMRVKKENRTNAKVKAFVRSLQMVETEGLEPATSRM